MTEHVSVDREGQLSGLAKPLYELLSAIHGKRGFALRQEYEVCVRMPAPEGPQQPQLVALQAMDARCAVLGALDIDGRGVQVDLLPANVHKLTDP